MLGDLVGTGGVAEVWRAYDQRLDRTVAVKLLSGPAARQPEHRRRIAREARALAAISHPNVVAVYDYAEESLGDGQALPYIVMEFVDGPDLAERLSADGPLDPSDCATLLEEILLGIEQAHELGIVHGDLKPANVFCAKGGAKVGDFGVARVLTEETGTTTLAATPTHAAPEVMRGDRPTQASDLYSAGCILFEVMCGRPPFVGRDFWELQRLHMEEPPPAAQDIRPDVPEHLARAVACALEKDPDDRPPSATAFARLLSPDPVAAAPEVDGPIPLPIDTSSEPPEDTAPFTPDFVESAPGSGKTLRLLREKTEALPRKPTRGAAILAAARRIPAGTLIAAIAVILLLTQALAQVHVPDLVGATLDDARIEATRRGLVVQVTEVDGQGEPGTVVGQDPQPGTRLGPGSTVTLHIARGSLRVPDVTGRTTADARQALTDAGLPVRDTLYASSEEVPPDHVIRTEPPAGTWVGSGTEIDIVSANPVTTGDDDGPARDAEDKLEEFKEKREELKEKIEEQKEERGRGDDRDN